MTLTIELTPQTEAWVNAQANQRGVAPEEFVSRLVDEQRRDPARLDTSRIPLPRPKQAAAYMRARLEQESTGDPEEIRQAEEEFEALKQSMNEERRRSGAEPVF